MLRSRYGKLVAAWLAGIVCLAISALAVYAGERNDDSPAEVRVADGPDSSDASTSPAPAAARYEPVTTLERQFLDRGATVDSWKDTPAGERILRRPGRPPGGPNCQVLNVNTGRAGQPVDVLKRTVTFDEPAHVRTYRPGTQKGWKVTETTGGKTKVVLYYYKKAWTERCLEPRDVNRAINMPILLDTEFGPPPVVDTAEECDEFFPGYNSTGEEG